MAEIFRRVEKKYILDESQYEKIKLAMANDMEPDQYGKSTICNIYFDSEDYELVRHSITKPFYKDKVRLRSYNTPKDENSKVYLEIKRKCDKIVGKRRIELTLRDFYSYMNGKPIESQINEQIKKELDYYFKFYNLEPKMYVSYEREAYYQKGNADFRVTFDSNIISRKEDLNLEKGSYGENILPKGKYIMELKTLGTFPLWLVKIINELNIKPAVFSKYGTAYTELVLNKEDAINKIDILEYRIGKKYAEKNNLAYVAS